MTAVLGLCLLAYVAVGFAVYCAADSGLRSRGRAWTKPQPWPVVTCVVAWPIILVYVVVKLMGD